MKLTKLQRMVKWVYDNYPQTRKSNTELLIQYWECAYLQKHGKNIPEDLKEIIRTYKPESITRARRFFAESTTEQYNEELQFRHDYSLESQLNG